MCSSNPREVLPFGVKVPNPTPHVQFGGNMSQVAVDLHRAQGLYDYRARLQYGIRAFPLQLGFGLYPGPSSTDPFLHHYVNKEPRIRYVHEEPKSNLSYIGLIATAILSAQDRKLVLSDIYQWIFDNYPCRTRSPGSRNSIRHNLSLNNCFIKSGRSEKGRGNYWAIHPANVDDFEKGDFRRRHAQRRVRRYMGLSVLDDDESPRPSLTCARNTWAEDEHIDDGGDSKNVDGDDEIQISSHSSSSNSRPRHTPILVPPKKRPFDIESLLAQD